jgi:hypothetical protein
LRGGTRNGRHVQDGDHPCEQHDNRILAAGVTVLWPRSASAADPETQLTCPTDRRIITNIDVDPTYVETRDPQTVAAAWREGTSGPTRKRLARQQAFVASETTTKIGYVDDARTMVAVLIFEKRQAGWYLASVMECA